MKELIEEYGYALLAGVTGLLVVGLLLFLLQDAGGLSGLARAFSKSMGG